jgi:4-amino-4-deoxy-L-arabinose transferase-like glycosyltransferase
MTAIKHVLPVLPASVRLTDILILVAGPEQITLRRPSPEPAASSQPAIFSTPRKAWALLLLVFTAVYFAALFSPALLDDADASHAQAAQHILSSGNWVTLYVDGIRYLEKPPLPYWMAAVDYTLFGQNVFATHLPMALGVLGCAILVWFWARRAWGDRAAFYAALGLFTSVGVFLFTRFFIPESILTFFEILALWCFLTGLEDRKPLRLYIAYASIALALLAKGLIAPVFFVAALVPYLAITGEWRRWREFRFFTGLLVFLAIGAPWHILCGLANPDHGHPVGNVPHPGSVHGFFYFYFINEHFLRFLGKRYPDDYNRQPWFAFWLGQLVWIFPWSLFLPLVLRRAWRNRHLFLSDLRYKSTNTIQFLDPNLSAAESSSLAARLRFRARTSLLLTLYAGFILVFFSISTNQEYYTWPIYPAAIMLIAGGLAVVEQSSGAGRSASRWLSAAHFLFFLLGLLAAAALSFGLWESRHLPYISDIGTLMAHRDVGGYTLSLSHFFDITGNAFAALRLPAVIAAIAFLLGPLAAWLLRRRHAVESTVTVALTMATILIAAHIALARFQPMLSSKTMAETINRITAEPSNADTQFMIYGDQSEASSVVFYTHRPALLVHGKTWYFQPGKEDHGELFGSSMIWGSCYPDAPHIFLSDQDLLHLWGVGPRHILFVPRKFHAHVKRLLGNRLFEIQQLSDKTLYTDRPL